MRPSLDTITRRGEGVCPRASRCSRNSPLGKSESHVIVLESAVTDQDGVG